MINQNACMTNGLCSMCCIAFILIFIHISLTNFKTLEYDEYQCFVTNVSYPQIINNTFTYVGLKGYNNNLVSNSISDVGGGFVDCDCGYKCVSNFGTCVQIYMYMYVKNFDSGSDGNIVLAQDTTRYSFDEQCTFREKKCKNGENYDDRLLAIKNAQQKALTYLNKNVTCYSDGNYDKLYLNIYTSWIEYFIFVGFTFIAFVLTGILLYKLNCKKTKSYDIDIEINPDIYRH